MSMFEAMDFLNKQIGQTRKLHGLILIDDEA